MADTANREKILRRIRGFQRIAEDQKGTPEGEAAAAMALKHIERHGVTDDELTEIEILVRRFNAGASEVWCRVLLSVIAKFHDCDSTHNTDSGMSSVYGDKEGIKATLKRYKATRKAVTVAFDAWVADCTLAHAGLEATSRLLGNNRPIRALEQRIPLNPEEHRDDFGLTVATGIRALLNAVQAAKEAKEAQRQFELNVVQGIGTAPAQRRELVTQREGVREDSQRQAQARAPREQAVAFNSVAAARKVLTGIDWLPKAPPPLHRRMPISPYGRW